MDDKKWLAIGDELVNSIKDKFPSNSEFSSIVDGRRLSYGNSVYWKLNNDPGRPNKPSRIILIIISGEAIDDSRYVERKDEVQERFKKYIDSKLKKFNPDHNELYGKTPPIEEWIVDNRCLNY